MELDRNDSVLLALEMNWEDNQQAVVRFTNSRTLACMLS